jgi:hypothetical protein
MNANWCFQNIGHMDAWYYFGEFRHFPHFQKLSPSYAGERLAWIVPGFILSRIFGQVNGVIALHVSTFLASLYALHYILRHTVDSASALLGAVLLGVYPCFIGSNGWDYVESMPILLFSASVALLIRASSSRRESMFVFLSAVSWFSLIYTFLAWAAFTPIYVGLAVWYSRQDKALGRAVVFVATRILCAGLLTTAGFAVVYRLFGLTGFFDRVTIQTAWQQFFISTNPWIDPTWYRQCTWLVFPVLAFSVGSFWIISMLLNRVHRRDASLPLLSFYAGCFLIMVLLTINKNRLLGFDYDASILTPMAFATLAATIFRVPGSVSKALSYSVTGLAAVISACPLLKPDLFRQLLHWQFVGPAAAILLVIGCAVPMRRRLPGLWAASVVLFALLSSCLVPAYPSGAWKSDYRGRDVSIRVSKAIDIVSAHLPASQYPTFWFDNLTDPLSGEFRGVMCSFLAHGRSMTRFPAVDADHKFARGERVFVLTHRKDQAEIAPGWLHSIGIEAAAVSQDLIDYGGVTYWISQFEIRRASSL